MGDDDELMEELAAAAVDEGLANTFKSAQLKQEAAELQRRVAAARLSKLEKAEPPDEDATMRGNAESVCVARTDFRSAGRCSVRPIKPHRSVIMARAQGCALLRHHCPTCEFAPATLTVSNSAGQTASSSLLPLHQYLE